GSHSAADRDLRLTCSSHQNEPLDDRPLASVEVALFGHAERVLAVDKGSDLLVETGATERVSHLLGGVHEALAAIEKYRLMALLMTLEIGGELFPRVLGRAAHALIVDRLWQSNDEIPGKSEIAYLADVSVHHRLETERVVVGYVGVGRSVIGIDDGVS